MKKLVATKETQGESKLDFGHAEEGETLVFTMECDGERWNGPCGCKRAMAGAKSHKATTTFKIVETDQTVHDFAVEVFGSLQEAGWLDKSLSYETLKGEDKTFVRHQVEDLLKTAAFFPAGSIIERHGSKFIMRKAPPKATQPNNETPRRLS